MWLALLIDMVLYNSRYLLIFLISHNLLEKRSLSRKFDLIGLFEGAEVADLSDKREFEGKAHSYTHT